MFDFLRTRVLRHAEDRLGAGLLALALLAFTLQSVAAHEFKAGDIQIKHPWSRVTPAGAQVAGGYLTLDNKGATGDRLVGASVDAAIAAKVEIHEMSVKDGIMTMRQLSDGLPVPAGTTVALAPGGFHLMILGLKQPLKQGERFKGALTFEKAGTVPVEFAVEGMAGPAGGSTGSQPDAHAHPPATTN